MSTGTYYLPAEDRVVLAFAELIERLAVIEPSREAVFPEALEAAAKWTVAGEEPDDLAFALTGFFFEMLEALARKMREE